jgi:hypothetical protein
MVVISADGGGKILDPLYMAFESINWCGHFGKQYVFLKRPSMITL